MKKIFSLTTCCLMIFSALFCFSIAGLNIQKTVIEDIYGVSVSCDDNYMTIYPFETAVFGIEVTNTVIVLIAVLPSIPSTNASIGA